MLQKGRSGGRKLDDGTGDGMDVYTLRTQVTHVIAPPTEIVLSRLLFLLKQTAIQL